ncbi:MAG: hypothetical protein RL499_960 [Actinomycetota bacterium]
MLIVQSLAVLLIVVVGVGWLYGAWKFYRDLRVGGSSARDYERRSDTGLRGLGAGVRLDVFVAAWPIVVALPERHRVRAARWAAVEPWNGRWPSQATPAGSA